MTQRLILASASPRRAELLQQIGLKFEVISSDIPEDLPDPAITPVEYVSELARNKAGEVANAVREGLVIGADTVVVMDGKILGKPINPGHASEMLAMLSGKEHSVFTGVAVREVPSGKTVVFAEETRVQFRMLSPEEIYAYVATGEPMDKAGAYGIQGKGAVLVERIAGCYFNVVGLPVSRLSKALVEFGISVW